MHEQFERAKREQPDALLFFRMGDFYELFGEDARIASRELGIALTSRDKGDDAIADGRRARARGRGVPAAARDQGVPGCDLRADVRTRRFAKGIVDRRIVRVVTAGTLTEEDALDSRASNYLAALFVGKRGAALAWLDVSTARFFASEVERADLEDELVRIGPAELLVSSALLEEDLELAEMLRARMGQRLREREAWRFERDGARRALLRQLGVATLEGFGIEEDSPLVPAAGALVEYLQETQRGACEHVKRIELVDGSRHLVLDRATVACLELLAHATGRTNAKGRCSRRSTRR